MTFLEKKLINKGYKEIRRTKNFIIAEGDIPICLIAHCDTVFNQPPKEWIYDYKKQVLWCPTGAGFDDRAGITAILKIINDGFRPHIVFTNGEEIGGVGAYELIDFFPSCPFQELKFMIELDREGRNDCVFYHCNNKTFIKKIESYGFRENYGSFTDISIIMPSWNVAGVNLSVGYYDEHSKMERIYIKQLQSTIKKVENILKDNKYLFNYKYVKAKGSYVPWTDIIYNTFTEKSPFDF